MNALAEAGIASDAAGIVTTSSGAGTWPQMHELMAAPGVGAVRHHRPAGRLAAHWVHPERVPGEDTWAKGAAQQGGSIVEFIGVLIAGIDWTRWIVAILVAAVLVVLASTLTNRNTSRHV